MAAPTQTVTGLVLRRTKLGETDVIVTLLAQDGSQYKAVAKGARKPTSTFASRLELFSIAVLLLAKGKNLDIVKEARLVEGNEGLRGDFIRSSAAAPLVELLAKSTFQDQPTPRLFDLARRSLEAIAATEHDPFTPLVAALLKTLAFLGFKPTFSTCVDCGTPLDLDSAPAFPFSYFDGGALCLSCARRHESTPLPTDTLRWCEVLLYSTLDEVMELAIDEATVRDLLAFTNEWIHVHLGLNLKSMGYIFKNILVRP